MKILLCSSMKFYKLSRLFEYFGRYSLVGAVNTILYFIITNAIIFLELADTIVASNFSYFFLIIASFLGHSNFTFRVKIIKSIQFKKFLTLSLIGLLISNFIIFLNTQHFNASPFLVILIISIIIPLINFFVLKYWVFKTD